MASFVDVGGEHLEGRRMRHLGGLVGQQHRQRIRFLAGGAGGHPDPHLVARLLVLEQFRNDVALDRLEGFAVAEEVGHADQHVVEQGACIRAASPSSSCR
jgi:hypothetical protein